MQKFKVERKLFLILFIVAAMTLSATARAQSSSSTEQTVVYLSPEEAKFLRLINDFRRKLGLNELRVHAGLQVAAEKHSKWMAMQDLLTEQDALSHFGPTPTTEFSDRINLEGYANYTLIGENVACGSESAEETFKQFAFSPSHLSNMLSPRFRHIGIARAGTGEETCPYYWTNDFGSKASPSTDAPAVDSIVQIANAIDSAIGAPQDGQSTAQILSQRSPVNQAKGMTVQCVVPYQLGRGLLTSSVNTDTTVDITPNTDGYMMKISYAQEGTNARFTSYSVYGAAIIKNAFYPLVTIFSAPNNKVGGFMIQVDVPTGRAQFDPYPGRGGSSGLITCKVR